MAVGWYQLEVQDSGYTERPDDLACSRQRFNDSMSEPSGCEAYEHMQHAITTEDRRECASAAMRSVLLK